MVFVIVLYVLLFVVWLIGNRVLGGLYYVSSYSFCSSVTIDWLMFLLCCFFWFVAYWFFFCASLAYVSVASLAYVSVASLAYVSVASLALFLW